MLFSRVFIATDPRSFAVLALSFEGSLDRSSSVLSGRSGPAGKGAPPFPLSSPFCPRFLALLHSTIRLLESTLTKVYQNKRL